MLSHSHRTLGDVDVNCLPASTSSWAANLRKGVIFSFSKHAYRCAHPTTSKAAWTTPTLPPTWTAGLAAAKTLAIGIICLQCGRHDAAYPFVPSHCGNSCTLYLFSHVWRHCLAINSGHWGHICCRRLASKPTQ